ncbi:hypothetical protein J2128_000113 [Methanomicrobium sp. W14]|nr:hypothetical protein [Methanomicrobium sp. W14]
MLVSAADESPGTPSIRAEDTWDNDGSYTIIMNLWWGRER